MVAFVLLIGGCQGSNGTDGGATVCAPPPDAAAPLGTTVSFARQIQPIFNTNCIVCHMTDGIDVFAEALLKLTSDVSYDNLAGVASARDPAFDLVEAGVSSASLLFLKISMDDPPIGDRMPLCSTLAPRAALTAAQIGLIRDWIDQGAQQN